MRCLNQRVDQNSEVSVSYVISGENEQNVITNIMDPRGVVVFTNPPLSREGKYESRSPTFGMYRLCFQSKDHASKSISFEFYLQDGLQEEKMATQDEITPIRTNFRKLSRNLDSVYRNIQFYERREKIHRDLAEVTCDRVLYSGIVKIVVACVVSVAQGWILKGFFSNKNANTV